MNDKGKVLSFKRNDGELFLAQLTEFVLSQNIHDIKKFTLYNFSFFSELMEKAISYSIKYGTPHREVLIDIKSGATKKHHFNVKMKDKKLSYVFQFLLISFMTWSMVLFTTYLELAGFSFFSVTLILILQIVGMAFFFILMNRTQKRRLGNYSVFFKVIYKLSLLLKVGLPLKICLEESGFNEVSIIEKKSLKPLISRLEFLISELQKVGSPIQTEIEHLKEEAWSLYEIDLEKLNKILDGVKLVCLALFFLPGHFIYIYSMISGTFSV
jgi:hypothetical protein